MDVEIIEKSCKKLCKMLKSNVDKECIICNDTNTDFQYTRENLYNIIERGQDAMEGILHVAQETEHPRAYEVVGQLMDKLTNANKELINMHKQVKDIKKEDPVSSPQNVTNALFVGSTAELQKLLKNNKVG